MLETRDSSLAPPTSEALGGVLVLLAMVLAGVDLYRWIGDHKPPSYAILFMPICGAGLLRRALAPEGKKPTLPLSWIYALLAYYLLVLLAALVEWRATRIEPLFVGACAFYAVAGGLRAYLERRKLTASGGET